MLWGTRSAAELERKEGGDDGIRLECRGQETDGCHTKCVLFIGRRLASPRFVSSIERLKRVYALPAFCSYLMLRVNQTTHLETEIRRSSAGPGITRGMETPAGERRRHRSETTKAAERKASSSEAVL